MQNLNPITLLLIAVILLPLISGLFIRFSRDGVRISLWSLVDNVAFIIGIFLSFYVTRKIFFDHSGDLFERIYNQIPPHIQTILYGQDILIYLAAGTIILSLFLAIMRPFLMLLYRFVVNPLAYALYDLLSAGGPVLKGVTGVLVQVPRAAFTVLMVGLALNFVAYYFPAPILSDSMNGSILYQALYQDVLSPALNSNLAKKIPVIVNDAFAPTTRTESRDKNDPAHTSGLDSSGQSLMKGRVIEYFNGVTLDTAVQSNAQIDETALQIVGNEKNGKKKAYVIYRWIATNIRYDYDKAAKLAYNPGGINSGSIVAFTERAGICFDYSSLYVSMCRAVGLKVRLVTGQAYSGTTWGDHAWNQVYLPEEGRWVNVDTTFGNDANYFDKPDFVADHRYDDIQGEW